MSPAILSSHVCPRGTNRRLAPRRGPWTRGPTSPNSPITPFRNPRLPQRNLPLPPSLPHGHVAASEPSDDSASTPSSPARHRTIALIVARVIDARSKLATARALPKPPSPPWENSSASGCRSDELYDAMDWLLAHRASDTTRTPSDLTSTYVEGTHCPLARRGYSRDGKKNKRSSSGGSPEGCPVAVESSKATPATRRRWPARGQGFASASPAWSWWEPPGAMLTSARIRRSRTSAAGEAPVTSPTWSGRPEVTADAHDRPLRGTRHPHRQGHRPLQGRQALQNPHHRRLLQPKSNSTASTSARYKRPREVVRGHASAAPRPAKSKSPPSAPSAYLKGATHPPPPVFRPASRPKAAKLPSLERTPPRLTPLVAEKQHHIIH